MDHWKKGEAPNSLVGDELHCQGHEGVLRPRPATSQDVSFLRLFHLFFDLGEERLGYLSPRSGKAVEFNQVSVSFCFRIDGTFFLRKQGQHLRKNEKVFQDSWHGKILLCATVEADHDQEEDEEEECEAGEGVDYRGGG